MSSHPKAGLGPQAQSHTVRTRLDDLARRYYVPLATFFRKRTHNAAEVQDLVQQVFLRLAQHRELGDIRNPDIRENATKTRSRFVIESISLIVAVLSFF